MPLRVTPSMMNSQLLRNINNNLTRMERNQNVLSTGKKIFRPADDPVGVTYALRYRSELSMNEQYQKIIDSARVYLDHTDTVLNQVNMLIQRANEITVQGVNGTNPQTSLEAIAKEMGQLYEQAVTLANDQINGKYTFNGQKTDQQPYTIAGAPTMSSDTQLINYQFGAGITIPVNVTGNEVFGSPTDSDNLFAVLKGLQNAFNAGNQAAASGFLNQLQSRLNSLLNVRADIGARSNRLDLIDNRNKDLNQNLTELDSRTEDADMAETIMKLKADQNVYQSSLSTGAKIIQPSLIDYLR